MTPAQLYTELTEGPLAGEIDPWLTAGNDNAVADILNRRDIAALGVIDRAQLVAWTAATGQRAVIEDVAAASGDPLRSVALALLDVIRGSLGELDFTLPGVPQLAEAWYAAGKMTQEQRDELLALAAITISRAEQIGISVSSLDVAFARESAQ